MVSIDYHAIAPELVLAGTALVVLVVDLFLRAERKWLAMPVSLAGVIASLAALVTLAGAGRRVTFGGMFVVDNYSLLFKALFLGSALIVMLVSLRHFDDGVYYQGEAYFLLLVSFLGMLLMPSARDLLMLFLALELVSAPAFLLAGWRKRDPRSNEGALKFFLIGVLATAVMLFGMSLVYGVTGHTNLYLIARALLPTGAHPVVLLAMMFVLVGFAFKVSAVPFHFWAPDTYEGAPIPVAAFLSVASKAAGFAGLLQVTFLAFPRYAQYWAPALAALSALTMTLGNLTALVQRNIVRLLAYSSIAQAGYMLLPFGLIGHRAGTANNAFAAILVYLLIYAFMNLGAFAVVVAVARHEPGNQISDYAGLGKRSPALAVAMTLFLLSLAGVPPLAGWAAKFFVFRATIQSEVLWLAVVMVANTIVGAFYYLGIIKTMWMGDPAAGKGPVGVPRSLAVAIAVAAAGVLAVGIYPEVIVRYAPLSTLLAVH